MHTVRLLQAEIDEETESSFRFLVDGRSIKYDTVAGGLFAADDLCFESTLLSLLPQFPGGDWNDVYVDKSADTGQVSFVALDRKQFASVVNCDWCSTMVNHVDLALGENVRTGVYKVTSPEFPDTVMAKFARFEWEVQYIDDECRAYSWITGKDIGPEFLAVLREDDRINGFLMTNIEGARHAEPEDLTLCQQALSKLHDLGILHGDINKHNFLIKDDRAVLIGFECARKTVDKAVLQEMKRLPEELAGTSGKGGRIVML